MVDTPGETVPQLDLYTIGDGALDRSRIDHVDAVLRPATMALLDRVGVGSAISCADVGCGPGGVTFELARRVGPGGRVVGLDIDDRRLDEARREASALRLHNVEFRLADVRTLAGSDEEFDLVYSRFLIDHFAHPGEVVNSMCRMLKPGGALVMECTDYTGWYCYPRLAAFDRAVELVSLERQRTGGYPDIGVRLPVLFVEAGIVEVSQHIFQYMEFAGAFKPWIISVFPRERVEWIAALGIADEAEVESVLVEVAKHVENPRTSMGTPRFVQCWGTKPDLPDRIAHNLGALLDPAD